MRRRCFFLFAPILQRAAAEWREARAEDHPRIDVIGIRHHLVGEGPLGLVEHRLNQLAAQTLELGLVVDGLLALRLALLPHVEAFARLLAELALLDEAREHIVRFGREVQLLTDVVGDIEPDHVHQLERAHRHAELHRRLVDLLARLAELIAAHRLHHVGRKHAVDEEARTVLHDQRQLGDGRNEGARLAHLLFARLAATHHLDQRQLRHRVEEVQSDQPPGIGERAGDVLELQR